MAEREDRSEAGAGWVRIMVIEGYLVLCGSVSTTSRADGFSRTTTKHMFRSSITITKSCATSAGVETSRYSSQKHIKRGNILDRDGFARKEGGGKINLRRYRASRSHPN